MLPSTSDLIKWLVFTDEERTVLLEAFNAFFPIGMGKETIDFDIADYWLLIMLDTQFDGNWTTLLEAAFGISGERAQKVKSLQAKMGIVGMEGLKDIIYSDVMKSDVDQATAWFYQDTATK